MGKAQIESEIQELMIRLRELKQALRKSQQEEKDGRVEEVPAIKEPESKARRTTKKVKQKD
jgi:hypothetical protein